MLGMALAESVTVTADALRINVADGEIKQTMRSEEIRNIPQLNQTSFLGLATLAGYRETTPGAGMDNPTLSVGSSANFNGAGTRGTTFQMNNDDSSENQHRQGVALAGDSTPKINTSKFRRATPPDDISDLTGRNTYFTDDCEQVDAGLYKTFYMLSNAVVIRFDVFNIFDHVTFGRILGTHPDYIPRTYQIGIPLLY